MFSKPKPHVTTVIIVIRKNYNKKTVVSCYPHRHLCVPEITLCSPSWCKRKVLKQWLFQHSCSKFDLPYFHQLVTGFHGNGNGISIPRFRFSAAPCQLRAVNAIWLTARIQNSSILKWQRERKRKCLPSHFTFLPLKRTQFYDCLSYWLTVIEHIQLPTVPLPTNQFNLFSTRHSFLPHYDLTGLWLPS